MTTHIIINAVAETAPRIETFRQTKCILTSTLGRYLPKENNRFVPGLDLKNFTRLLWLLQTYDGWSRVESWTQILDFYWTDPTLLRRMQQSKTSPEKTKNSPAATLAPLSSSPLLDSHCENTTNLKYIKGSVRCPVVRDMEYEEHYKQEEETNLKCPERPYSFQVKTKDMRPLHQTLGEMVHLFPTDYIVLKRQFVFHYLDFFSYQLSVQLAGRKTKYETVQSGFLSYQVKIQVHHFQKLLDAKNNIQLAGDLCEKTIDLLGRRTSYSVIVLLPCKNEGSQSLETRNGGVENLEEEPDTEEEEKLKLPMAYAQLLS